MGSTAWQPQDANKSLKIEFTGKGGSYLWLLFWTNFLTVITLGFFLPWAICHRARWNAKNTFVNGNQLIFTGKGAEIAGVVYISVLLSIITLTLFAYWAACSINRWIYLKTKIDENPDHRNNIDIF